MVFLPGSRFRPSSNTAHASSAPPLVARSLSFVPMNEIARADMPGADRPSERLRPSLIFIGLLPPPVDGQRMATAEMRALLEGSFRLRVHNIGPRDPTSLVSRLLRTAAAMFALLVARTGGCRRLYLAPYSGRGLWLAAALQGWARVLGYRTAVHLHSHLPVADRLPAMAAFTRAGGDRVVYVCLGARMAAALTSRYAAVKRTCVLGNAILIHDPPARRRRTAGDRPLRLGHLGNLNCEKGLDTVLLTARALVDADVPFVLELAGPAAASERTLIAAAVAADPDRVHWLGPLYGRAKDEWFDSLDVFLLPTRYAHEASPLVLFEAMRSGVVPIATSRGCIPDDVGDAGHLVADARPEAFVAAARACLQAYHEGRDDLDAASARAFARYQLLRKTAAGGLAALIAVMSEACGGGPASDPPPDATIRTPSSRG